jgi:hypothetical protein
MSPQRKEDEMKRIPSRKVVAGTIAGLAVAGGGAAVAASKFGSPGADSQAVVNDAAKQLGVQPSALSDALKKALENRVDAAVAAGQLTQAEGDAMKARIQSGAVPLFFGGRGFHEGFGHHGRFGGLDAAATYLGLTAADLRTQVEAGKTLAQIATAQGKSVDGLIQALVNAEQKELAADVAAGRLTQAQADSMLADAKQHITDFVNGKEPAHGPGEGPPAVFGDRAA